MSRMKRFLIACALLIATAGVASAQFDFMGAEPEPPVWEKFKLNPSARIKLDFRNASMDAVIQLLSRASGVTIIKDPSLVSTITLQSPRPISLHEAFAMFNTVLGLKNLDMKKEGNFLVIRQRQSRSPFGNMSAEAMQAMMGGGSRGGRDSGASQLKVYTVKYANASQVARVINEVFAMAGMDQGVMPGAPGVPGTPGGFNPAMMQSPAGADPFRRNQGNRGGGFGGFGGMGFGMRRGVNMNLVVRASADDFSNSVIVNAPSREHEQIKLLLEQIDKQTDQPQQSRVFNLQYANAADLAVVVQNVLVSNAPRGRGGIGTQNVPIDQRFQQAARFGSMQAAFGTVAADQRTNSLVVTATPDNLAIVEKVIKELDREVEFENSAFVITLENARADAVAQLLNQSFGGRSNFNSGFGGGFGSANRTQNQQRRNNTNRGMNQNINSPGGGGNRPGGLNRSGRSADISAAEESGEAEESQEMQVAQFPPGGFGGGGAFRQQPQNRSVTGLDNQGRVVNVRDLTGGVTVIPDVSTNSIIVVTSPENREIVERILSQLDRIPEQVMIETLIVEASLDASTKMGVEWNFTKGSSTGSSSFGVQADNRQPQGLRYTLTGSQYNVFLQALKSDSRFEVLSTPRIFTSNNATAQINISQSLPYVLNQRVDVNGNLLYNYAFLDVGIILTVTPRITSNGYVTMDVTQTANDFVRYTEFNAPVVNQREAQTTVSVRDGETVVLGGIIKNSSTTTTNKVPVLGDIPLIGNLFRSTSKARNKTELLVFLTPRVVRSDAEARTIRERTEKQLEPKTLEKVLKTQGQTGAQESKPPTKEPEQEKPPVTDPDKEKPPVTDPEKANP
jgi:general secretion pathway protein D